MNQTAHPDTCVRCPWIRGKSAEYIAYHDNEWGRPLHDERKLYELFTIELFQAGLSWELLLAKRENFRIAYDGFDPIKVAGYGPADVERLMADKGIVRNRGKIEASISNTNVILGIAQEYGGFEAYLWGFVDGEPVIVPPEITDNRLSRTVSKDLKHRGIKYAGPVTIHSFLQAAGIINAHAPECWVYQELVDQAAL